MGKRKGSGEGVSIGGALAAGAAIGGIALLSALRPRVSLAGLNVVVVLTDDQRWDTTWAMPIMGEKLAGRGTAFTHAFASTPLCDPFRASLLSGGFFPYNTGVVNNGMPNGGARKVWNEGYTLGRIFQQSGYRTAMLGKYRNGYGGQMPYIPPGWSEFAGWDDGDSWTDFDVGEGSSEEAGVMGTISHQTQYITDYFRDRALGFISGNEPFFCYLAFTTPHGPATPHPDDVGKFEDYSLSGRGYFEADLSDKPLWVRQFADTSSVATSTARKQLVALQPADRAIGAIVDRLADLGRLGRTVIVFTSDNGFMLGEHGLTAKGKPYEESVRVPLVVRGPGIPSGRVDSRLVAVNLDVGATLLSIATGRDDSPTDGKSLLFGGGGRATVHLQSYQALGDEGGGSGPRWGAVRSERYKYVLNTNGDEELYDLAADPLEMESRHGDPILSGLKDSLRKQLSENLGLCVITDSDLPSGRVGVPYQMQLSAWGGQPPYRWEVASGRLPNGLALDSASGVVSGIPTTVEATSPMVWVTDSGEATHLGWPQTYRQRFQISVGI